MSFAGLKKHLNRAGQAVLETVGTAEPTNFDKNYDQLEKRLEITQNSIKTLIDCILEYLQPNAAQRKPIASPQSLGKARSSSDYKTLESSIALSFSKYGTALGSNSEFGEAMIEASETYKNLADLRFRLDEEVRNNFINPLQFLLKNEIKTVMDLKTDLRKRRLDYDSLKRTKQARDEELIAAEKRLEDSKQLTEKAIFGILSNDIEQISQLYAFIEAQENYHQQVTEIFGHLKERVKSRIESARERPQQEHVVQPVFLNATGGKNEEFGYLAAPSGSENYGGSSQHSPNLPADGAQANWASSADRSKMDLSYSLGPVPLAHANATQPVVNRAFALVLYDFKAEQDGELDLHEGDKVEIITRVDENWLRGEFNGKVGIFPSTYVKIVQS